jgi:tryptophan-rich sensory protein
LVLFAVQLVLNAAWSFIFFGLRQPGWAALEIGILWIAIAATLVAFWQVRPLAGILLMPYLAWVTFATGLNVSIWQRNLAGV